MQNDYVQGLIKDRRELKQLIRKLFVVIRKKNDTITNLRAEIARKKKEEELVG